MPTYDVYVAVKLSIETRDAFSMDQVKKDAETLVDDALNFTCTDRKFYRPTLGDEGNTEVIAIKAVSCTRVE